MAGASVVCSNSGTSITLTGLTGGIEKWQSSTDNWATTNDINSADNPLATGPLAVTTEFRAVVQNGVCAIATSSAAMVLVDTTPPVMVGADEFHRKLHEPVELSGRRLRSTPAQAACWSMTTRQTIW